MPVPARRRLGASCACALALLTALGGPGCGGSDSGPAPGEATDAADARSGADSGGAGGGASDVPPAWDVAPDARTEADTPAAYTPEWLYDQHCANCHGEQGQGGLGPELGGWSDQTSLALRIHQTMPPTNPSLCEDLCADRVAAYVIETFGGNTGGGGGGGGPIACDEGTGHVPPRVRLLSRREYRETVRDLLWPCADEPSAPCAPPACGETTFRFDPGALAYASVHVAGSFNGWAESVAGGGLSLSFDGATGLWTGTATLDEGLHTYKFVADGQWVSDPMAPLEEPDGFGGVNSAVLVDCDESEAALATFEAPEAGLPPDARPAHYAFDGHAGAALVTSVGLNAYLDAATALANAVAPSPWHLVPCADPEADPSGCAQAFVESFGARALRRPLTPDEVARYAALFEGEGVSDFLDGVTLALEAFLVSPSFLYRVELGQPTGDGVRALDAHEIATALSYALWGAAPDAALRDAAAGGALDTVEGLEAEARRLLDDPRARELIRAFAEQWLGVADVPDSPKKDSLFPGFDTGVREALVAEAADFVEHVVFDASGRAEELFNAGYTVATAPLEALYELPPGSLPATGQPQVVSWPHGRRAGVLGLGGVLSATAHSDQSSPIRRGLFVRQRLLCQELPPPPPDAGGVPEVDPDATTKERFEQHSSDPTCKSCHQYIDPVGFGFEAFDAIGRWRTVENGMPIDAAGDLTDVEGFGTQTSAPFANLPELGQILAGSDAAASCVATQLYRFALGRIEEADADACHVEALAGAFVGDGLDQDITELLVALVTSEAFRLRGALPAEASP